VVFFDFFDRSEPGLEQVIFSRMHFARRKLHDVNDAEMDSSYFGRIIVDQADDAIGPPAFDLDFFGQFTMHAGPIPILSLGVLDRDMATDPDRLQRVQPLFPLSLPPRVLKQSGPLYVVAFENDVGDELLEGRVGFDQASGAKGLVGSVQQSRQIPINRGGEPGKRSELVKQSGGDDEHFFVFWHDENGSK
jgi:hypothetical protein